MRIYYAGNTTSIRIMLALSYTINGYVSATYAGGFA